MTVFERPAVRWAIAFAYLVVSLLLFLVFGDLPKVDQVVVVIMVSIGFFILPSALKDYAKRH